jgi:hypothetical protein
MSNLKIIKLDKRYRGGGIFKYRVTIKNPYWLPTANIHTVIEDFFKMRTWCYQTWGESCELNEWLIIYGRRHANEFWCWDTDSVNKIYHLYLKTEKERNWFSLKWE